MGVIVEAEEIKTTRQALSKQQPTLQCREEQGASGSKWLIKFLHLIFDKALKRTGGGWEERLEGTTMREKEEKVGAMERKKEGSEKEEKEKH